MAYRDTILAETSLQSYWEMDETSGNIADSEGAVTGTTLGNNTYLQSSLIYSGDTSILIDPGADSGACGFDMGDVYDFTGTAAFSIEAWVKPGIIDASNRIIAGKEDTSGLNYGYYVAINSSNVSFRRRDASVNDSRTFAYTFSVGVTYHVVATFDGSNMRVYVDGSELASSPQSSTASLIDHTAPFRVGSHSQGGNRIRGTLDEVAIYNAALGSSAVTDHYNAGIASVPVTLRTVRASLRW